MNKKISLLTIASIIVLSAIMMIPNNAIAEPIQNTINVKPINEKFSLETTIITMSVPENNKLPWGTVWGTASEVAERYPVIIQFYKDDAPVHVAQVDVKGDGSYEYKFRVRNIDNNTGEIIDIFEGQYTVKIFRVIHNQNDVI